MPFQLRIQQPPKDALATWQANRLDLHTTVRCGAVLISPPPMTGLSRGSDENLEIRHLSAPLDSRQIPQVRNMPSRVSSISLMAADGRVADGRVSCK